MRILRQYLFAIQTILCLAACSDELVQRDNDTTVGGQAHVYTLRLAIDDGPATRSLTSVDVGTDFKTRWCYGDKVTLQKSGSTTKYNFVIETPTGKQDGDPVTDRVATFTYKGTAISSFTNFTGTVQYYSGINDDPISAGYTVSNIGSTNNRKPILGRRRVWQLANDNAGHLKCLDNLTADIANCDLRQPKTITLTRNLSILKIVLNDIYYPIFGGAILCVDGFNKSAGGKGTTAMVLGYGLIGDTGDDKYPYGISDLYVTTPQNPIADKDIQPFYNVPVEKDPITNYAVRDEENNLVVYMPLLEEYEMPANGKISICLRDSWSMDNYYWETEPLKPFKLPLGTLYTIDLTQKVGGRHKYESFAAINLGFAFTEKMGSLISKNIGAKSPADPGEYYMFGHEEPIVLGEHYPRHPKKTGYYFYKEGKAYYYDNGIGNSTDTPCYYYVSTGKQTMLSLPNSVKTAADWWKEWVKGLTKLPSFGMEWAMPYNLASGRTLPISRFRDFDKITEEVVKVDNNPVGVRLSNKRTGHSVFLPVSDVLEPSEKAEELDTHDELMRFITPDAVAQKKEATLKHAVLTGAPINVTNDPVDAIQLTAYTFVIGEDNTTITNEALFYELDTAVPIRPTLFETSTLSSLLDAIPQ